jgi:hypothetical protein
MLEESDIRKWVADVLIDNYSSVLIELLGQDFKDDHRFKKLVESIATDPDLDVASGFTRFKAECYGRIAA